MKGKKVRPVIFFLLCTASIVCTLSQIHSVVKLSQSKVSLIQSSRASCNDLTYDDIKAMVKESIDLVGGISSVVKNGDTVVIKPNLVCIETMEGTIPSQMNGITTDWRTIKALVELVRTIDTAGKVYVMEGAAYPTKAIMEYLHYTPAEIPGVDEFIAIEESSGGWQETSSPLLVNVSPVGAKLKTSYYLNRLYKEADVLISVPTLKNHGSACISGSVKNIGIGAPPANIYGRSAIDPVRLSMVSHYTDDIHKWIHDFFLCRPVDFVLMEGFQGIQNGPGNSSTRNLAADQMNMRLMLASKDPVAIDTIAGLIMNWDPQSANHLVYLNNSSAGNIDSSCITVIGKKVAEVRKDFAGTIPMAGGAKVTDKTAPALSVSSYGMNGSMLNISCSAASETVKIEVYIDGTLKEPVITSNYAAINLDLSGVSTGTHTASVYAYDRFLNQSVQEFAFEAASTGTPAPTIATTSAPTPESTPASTQGTTGTNGDVNGNGSADIVDALLIAQYYVGTVAPNFNQEFADVNCSGSIDIVDALMVAQFYVGLRSSLVC